MAGDIVNIKTNEVEKQRLSFLAITLSNWENTLEPVLLAGSKSEIAGSLYEFTADEDIDNSSNWAGIANDRIVYIKAVPSGATAVVLELTTDPPTWSTSKQGYYGVSGSTLANERYIASVYKSTTGGYPQKAIYINRESKVVNGGLHLNTTGDTDKYIRFTDEAYIKYNNSSDVFEFSKSIYSDRGRWPTTYIHSNANKTHNDLFIAFNPSVPNVGDMIIVVGEYKRSPPPPFGDSFAITVTRAERTATDEIKLYGSFDVNTIYTDTLTAGDTNNLTNFQSIAW